MNDPPISVVIPARNAEPYIVQALESALAQTLRPHEVVVVDDGSSDRTAAIAASFGDPVRVLRVGFASIGAARNAGVTASSGALLAFLDADDLWEPRWLELAVGALEQQPEADMVVGSARQFLDPGLDPAVAKRLRFADGLREAPVAGAILISRETFDVVGPFETRHGGAEFSDWLLRARDTGLTQTRVHEHTLSRRIHGSNNTLTDSTAVRDHLWAIRESLGRRRAKDAT